MNRWTLLLLPLAACDGCGRCRPDLPDTDTADADTDPDTRADTDPDTDPPPCDWPEVEPNDAFDQATVIPLETEGCGTIDPALDLDQWAFTVTEPLWLGVHVLSTSIGSRSDVALVLTRDETESLEVRDREDGEQDVILVFPALPGDYAALILDEGLLGGSDDYFYELLVTEEKQPVAWTVASLDAHTEATAQPVTDGDVVFGEIGAAGESDWYAIPIPAGTSSVELSIEAALWGSPADVILYVYDAAGDRIAAVGSGPSGERDPLVELPTTGDTTWTIRVAEQATRGGSAYWYTLFVDLKGDP